MKKGEFFSLALYRFTLKRLFIPAVVLVTLCALLFSTVLFLNREYEYANTLAPAGEQDRPTAGESLPEENASASKDSASGQESENEGAPLSPEGQSPQKKVRALSFSQIYCATTLCLPLSSILVYCAFFQLRRRKNADFIDALPLSRGAVFSSTVLAALSAMILSILALWLILLGASELMSEKLYYNMSASQLGAGLLNELVLLVFFAALFSFGISISGRLLPSLFIGYLPVYTAATFFLGLLLMYAPFIPLLSLPLTALPLPDISLPLGGEAIHLELSLEYLFAAAVLPIDGLLRSGWFLRKVTPAALPGVFSDIAAGRVLCLAIAAVFFVAALLIYRKRKSETAGKEGFPIVADLLLPALLFAPGLFLGVTVILYSIHLEQAIFSLFSLFFLLPLAPLLIIYLIARGKLCVKRWRQVLLCLLPTLLCLALAFGGQLGLSALASADLPAEALASVDFMEELTTLYPDASPKHHGDYQRLQVSQSTDPQVLQAVAEGLDFRLLLPATTKTVKTVKVTLKNGLVIGRLVDVRDLIKTVMDSGERSDVNADDYESFYVVIENNTDANELSIPITRAQAERYIACYNGYSTAERKEGEATEPNRLPLSLRVARKGYEEHKDDHQYCDHTESKTEVLEPYAYDLVPPAAEAEQILADLLLECLEDGLDPGTLTLITEEYLSSYRAIHSLNSKLRNLQQNLEAGKSGTWFIHTSLYVQGSLPLKASYYSKDEERSDLSPSLALYDQLSGVLHYNGQEISSNERLGLLCAIYLLDNQHTAVVYLPVVLTDEQYRTAASLCQ